MSTRSNTGMRILRHGWLAAACACLGLFNGAMSALAQDTRPSFLHQIWRSEEGLPGSAVFSILQSQDGYLLARTSEGIFRFDGTEFVQVHGSRISVGEPEPRIALAQTRDGSIWGCVSNGLVRIHRGKTTIYSAQHSPLPGPVLTLFEDRSGIVWVGCSNGLAQIVANERIIACPNKTAALQSSVHAIVQDKSNTLWFGTDKGLVELKDGNATSHPGNHTKSEGVRSLCLSRDGGLWVGSELGLGYFKNGAWRKLPDSAAMTRGFEVQALYEEPSGALWIGGARGILHLAGGTLCVPATSGQSSFESGNVVPGIGYAFCRDKDGNLWIGTSSGLNRLRTPDYLLYDQNKGLPESETASVLVTRDHSVWIGTRHGWLSRMCDGKVTNWQIAHSAITALWEGRDGTLWAGTENEGLFGFADGAPDGTNTPGSQSHYTAAPNGLPSNNVRVIYQDRKGTLWIGGSNSLCQLRDGKFSNYPDLSQIRVITEDTYSNIWIGSQLQLTCISNGQVRTYSKLPTVPRTSVNALYAEPEGALWIGCDNGDLLRYSNGVFKRCCLTPGLFERVLHLSKDHAGNLWTAARNGIFRMDAKQLSDYADNGHGFVDCIKLDGSYRGQCAMTGQPGIQKTHDGQMWFAGASGTLVVDPKTLALQTNSQPPSINIEQVLFEGQPVTKTWLTQRNPSSSSLEIHYSALSLRMPGDLLFRCRLEGREDWREMGTRRFVRYDNLPVGQYTFQVTARSGQGVWNTVGTSFKFRVSPPFYRSASFYAFALSVLLGAVFAAWRIRLRHLRQRQQELERLVEERTAELQAAVAELEHFSNTITHDMRAPLRAMRGYGDMLLEQAESLPASSGVLIGRISTAAGRMDRLITDALDYSKLVRHDFQFHPVDMKKLICGMIDSYPDFQMPQANISIQGTLPLVLGNEAALTQCFSNLLNNGVKFVHPGQTPQIRIWAEDRGEVARFWVEDNGIGIPAECREKIFIMFHRMSTRYEGTGIGLALVKKAAERMGGRVGVDSETGKGSRFWLELKKAAE